MCVTVRLATKNDAELIADLSRQTFYDTFAMHNTREDMDKFMNEQFTKEKLVAEVAAPGNIFLLAYEGNETAGYTRLRDNNNPEKLKGKQTLEIARIYATKNSIGKGVGKALMLKSIDIAKEMKKEIVWLGVWEKNRRAIEFYQQWGFEKFDEYGFILGNDVQKDWLMKKKLP
jgi:ribosomal protein S18 acetylase RimI-like enzyme